MDGRAVRWKKHNEARRERLVGAAVELVEAGDAEFTLQQVGERAGLSRSVVYRHFADRRDLVLAVQQHVIDDLSGELLPTIELAGSPRYIVEGICRAYVHWAVAHPELHRIAEYDTADGPLQRAIDQISVQVAEVVLGAFEGAGAEVREVDRKAADPLVHGLVGMVFGAVRRWVQIGESVPDAEHMIGLLSEAIMALLEARTRAYGVPFEPDTLLTAPE